LIILKPRMSFSLSNFDTEGLDHVSNDRNVSVLFTNVQEAFNLLEPQFNPE